MGRKSQPPLLYLGRVGRRVPVPGDNIEEIQKLLAIKLHPFL